MPKSFQEIIQLIRNGDPVDSSINTILRTLAGNAEYLKQLLDEIAAGETISIREATVANDVKVGQPVYFNKQSDRFERALASGYIADSGDLVVADSTQVWGICQYKHNSTSADILLQGYAAVNVSEAITGNTAGLYYLSGSAPGKLVQQQPPVSVAVLYWDGSANVFVNPSFNNPAFSHQHYKFNLVAETAGDHVVPSPGGHHAIINADNSLEGWLPASDSIFNGKAPANALFGYNIARSSLNALWPPLPANGATLGWVRPTTTATGTVQVPGAVQSVDTFTENQVFTDGTETLVTKALAEPPTVSTAIVAVYSSLYTDLGLTVRDVMLASPNVVTFKVANNTGSSQTAAGSLTIVTYAARSVTTTSVVDFTEDSVPDGLVTLNSDGIWWLSDCYGLVPWPVNYGEIPADVDVVTTLFAASTYGVTRRDLVSNDNTSVLYGENAAAIKDVAIDAIHYHAYVTNPTTKSVDRINTNEAQRTATRLWTGTGGSSPFGVDFDVANNHVYFSDVGSGKLYRIDGDGQNVVTLLSSLSAPRGLRIDIANNYIYFIDGTDIKRCELDGSSVTTLVTGLNTPEFLAFDVDADALFWTDTGVTAIQKATLTGAAMTNVAESAVFRGIDLDIDAGKVYFTDGDTDLYSCDYDGSNVTLETSYSFELAAGGLRLASLPEVNAVTCADLPMELTLWFSKMQYQTALTAVTSLRAAEGSGLTVRCVHDDDTTKTTGDLEIDFDPNISVSDIVNKSGHIVFKSYENKEFKRGPVVEAIVVDSDYLVVSSTSTSGNKQQGIVTLSFTPTPVGSEIPVEMVRLNNVTEENYKDVLGLGFPENVDAEYRAKINIPYAIEATTVKVKLRFVVLARTDGNIPALTLTARVIPRPGQTTAGALTLPTVDSSVVLSVASLTAMTEDTYAELQSAEINTTAGSSVLFTLKRSGSTDAFAGDIHVIDQRAVITNLV